MISLQTLLQAAASNNPIGSVPTQPGGFLPGLMDVGKSAFGAQGGTVGKTAGSTGGAALGTAVAGPVGGLVGGKVGGFVGDTLGKLVGGKGAKKKAKREEMMALPIAGQEPRQQFDPGFLSMLVQQGGGFNALDAFRDRGGAIPLGGFPGYAQGTEDQPGGPAIVGENGPELAILAPRTPVIPFDFGSAVSEFVPEPATQMGQDSGWLGEIVRALGPNPFGESGSLGGLSEAIGGALKPHDRGGRLALGGIGALGNILVNRELGQQSEVEKLNEQMRLRTAARNQDLVKRNEENRAESRKVAGERRAEQRTIDAETRAAQAKAGERRFVLSPKVAEKLNLPAGERVTFDQYTKALELAKDKLPTNEFDRVLAASPAEWSKYVARKAELDRATTAAKPAKEASADEKKAASFYNSGRLAVESVTKAGPDGGTIEKRIAALDPIEAGKQSILPDRMKSTEYRQYHQAKLAFALAILRRQSGSAINKDEFDKIDKAFFVQPGDPDELIAQKQAGRQYLLDGLKVEAGGAVPAFNPAEFWESD